MLVRLGMLDVIANILKNKENALNKVDETVQLREFLLSSNNKLLGLPFTLRFGILRMFHKICKGLKLSSFSEVKILDFCSEYRNNLVEFAKTKNQESLILGLWLFTAIDVKPEENNMILELIDNLKNDPEFNSLLAETKFALLNLEMECIHLDILKPNELKFNRLSSTLESLFKSLETLLEAKNFEIVIIKIFFLFFIFLKEKLPNKQFIHFFFVKNQINKGS